MIVRRKRGGTATISLHVRDVVRLFDSLGPSPFRDRDLDRDAAAFIEDEFSDRLAERLQMGQLALARRAAAHA